MYDLLFCFDLNAISLGDLSPSPISAPILGKMADLPSSPNAELESGRQEDFVYIWIFILHMRGILAIILNEQCTRQLKDQYLSCFNSLWWIARQRKFHQLAVFRLLTSARNSRIANDTASSVLYFVIDRHYCSGGG